MLGAALLGAGIFAQEQHLPAIESLSSLKLKAVFSRSEKSAVSLASKAHCQVDVFYDSPEAEGKSLDDLLARADISVVIICVTIPVQFGIIQKAIRAGKHVLSEKPIAPDAGIAKGLIDWYNDQVDPPMWAVAENFRFNQSVCYAGRKLRNLGGQLITFRLSYNAFVDKDNKYFNTQWRRLPEFQGGFMLDSGVHYIATLRHLLGTLDKEIQRLAAYSTRIQEHLVPVDTLQAIVSTKDGCHGTISLSFGTKFKSGLEIEVVTTNGVVLWTPIQVKTTECSCSGDISNDLMDFVYSNAVDVEIDAFCQAIISDSPDPRQSPIEALKDLAVVQALLESGEADALIKNVEI